MISIKKHIPWTIRIIVSLLFLLSGIAKLFPLWAFEKQIVDLGLGSWCFASYLARGVISLEIAIAIAILQAHFLKKIIIPATILLLTAFCIHLSIEMVKHGAMNGNCGCFGQLLPMTPLEAFIKNVLTIALLLYLYRHVNDKKKGENKLSVLLIIYFMSTLLLFMAFPFCTCKADTIEEKPTFSIDTTANVSELIQAKSRIAEGVSLSNPQPDTSKKLPDTKSPKKIKSIFSQFGTFGNTAVDLDDGKKIVCFFAPGCDHCQAAAKELCLKKDGGALPNIYILFMDEEAEKIPDFFKIASCNFPFKILDIPTFFKLMGDAQTPCINYLWNGHIIKSYNGIGDAKFDIQGLIKSCKAKHK